jgi:hypothetical protein
MSELIINHNEVSLVFKKITTFDEIESLLPTILIYANNGEFVYQPYVFEKVEIINDLNEIDANFQNYFVLAHDFYSKTNFNDILKQLHTEILNGKYIHFGSIDKFNYDRF